MDAGKTLREMDARIDAARREQDYLEFQFQQLDEAALREGELEALEEEQGRLAYAESVKELNDFEGIVLVEQRGKSRVDLVDAEVLRAKALGKDILGIVLA